LASGVGMGLGGPSTRAHCAVPGLSGLSGQSGIVEVLGSGSGEQERQNIMEGRGGIADVAYPVSRCRQTEIPPYWRELGYSIVMV
jgi:hypothetical protein